MLGSGSRHFNAGLCIARRFIAGSRRPSLLCWVLTPCLARQFIAGKGVANYYLNSSPAKGKYPEGGMGYVHPPAQDDFCKNIDNQSAEPVQELSGALVSPPEPVQEPSGALVLPPEPVQEPSGALVLPPEPVQEPSGALVSPPEPVRLTFFGKNPIAANLFYRNFTVA